MTVHPIIAIFFLLFCLSFSGRCAFAQDTPDFGKPATENSSEITADQALQQVQAKLDDRERRWYGLVRARWSYPQKLSAGLGAIFVEQRKDTDCSHTCMMYGWHFEIEPGLYGVQGSLGWGKLIAETGNTKRLLHTAYWGWAVRGVVLRTWGDSPLRPQSQTLAGIEGSFPLLRLNFSLGVLHSLSSKSESDWLITAGFGWGF